MEASESLPTAMSAFIESLSFLHPVNRSVSPATRRSLRRMVGPGLLVAVGYVDPGNWATDIAAGSSYGYTLLGSVLLASLLGLLFQTMAARLGMATGEDLAALTRRLLPRPLALSAWLASELAIVATALAELVGGAIALRLLFGLPLQLGMVIAALGTLAIMALSQQRRRAHEYVVSALLAIVSLTFVYLLIKARPDGGEVLHGLASSAKVFGNHGMLAVALGIVGATVMPHNLFLHSGLIAERSKDLPARERPMALRVVETDTRVSLLLATLVNAAMLTVAAASLSHIGMAVNNLDDAYHAIALTLGAGAAVIFAVALYAAGQSSAITGVLAGRILSRGFRGRESRTWLRGIVTRLAGVCIGFVLLAARPGIGADTLLVLSQCVLGVALPFALLPMLMLARKRDLMGSYGFGRAFMALAGAGTALVIALDGYLLMTAFG
ncbi:Nramp family divalent metal transporter [Rhodanobacter sp. BL-MT-08]